MRILLVEDERRLSSIIKKGLTEEGFAVDTAFDGEEGHLAEGEAYDAIILDIMLPKVDGITLCRELRNKQIKTPVLMLTAKTTVEDKVAGLDSGADDYLTKPFASMELRSRLHALIRRSKQESSRFSKLPIWKLDPIKHKAGRAGKTLSLTPKEFAILNYFSGIKTKW